ncbi:MAG: protein kinase, partial [Candidatus Aminicenantes bacterium]|nr:protein kinase [Candidatus Aminicenantes bacterium]
MKCPKCQTDNPPDSKFCKECATPLPSSGGIAAPQTETLLPPREDLATGSTFAGRYQVIEELGRGGMGKVYKVLDKETNSKVALKVIRPGITADKNVVQRFKNELKMARDISHKNICRVYDLGNEAENYFYTMEYVHGEDLRELIRRTRRLDVGTAISIAEQVSEGLAEAHKQGVIHRDLKPGNIMIDRDGNAKIMDFGIARSLRTKGITGPGAAMGTPEYMSPEQAEGKDSDQRADIYALGIILYEMVTGTVPFEGETPFAVGLKHRTELPENPKKLNPQIPDDLGRLVLKCLEKKKEDRPKTAGDVLSELTRIEQRLPTTDRVIPKRKPITSREITVHFNLRKLVGPGLALAAIVVAVILVVLLTKRQAPREPLLPSHQQLTFTGDAYWPAITPDGQFIAYVKRVPADEVVLMMQDVASGQALEVLRARECRHLRWTPDGSELSFWAQMQDSSSGIYIIPRLGVGATPRRLDAGRFIAWSPDGSRFATCHPD